MSRPFSRWGNCSSRDGRSCLWIQPTVIHVRAYIDCSIVTVHIERFVCRRGNCNLQITMSFGLRLQRTTNATSVSLPHASRLYHGATDRTYCRHRHTNTSTRAQWKIQTRTPVCYLCVGIAGSPKAPRCSECTCMHCKSFRCSRMQAVYILAHNSPTTDRELGPSWLTFHFVRSPVHVLEAFKSRLKIKMGNSYRNYKRMCGKRRFVGFYFYVLLCCEYTSESSDTWVTGVVYA